MSNRDLVLDDGKLIIPRNANIFLPVGLPHMSSAVYKDADQFLPNRWLEPDAEYMPGGFPTLFSCCDSSRMLSYNSPTCFESTCQVACLYSFHAVMKWSHAVMTLTCCDATHQLCLNLMQGAYQNMTLNPSVLSHTVMRLTHLHLF